MDIRGAWDVVAGVFLLILIYLLLSRGKAVNDLIKVSSGSALKGIALLQGRASYPVQV